MVEISKSGSGEGSVWETGRGYSTRRGDGSCTENEYPAPSFETGDDVLYLTVCW